MPDAQVVLLNVNTGNQRSTMTNAAGQYNFPTVPAGIFNVTVTKEGFRAYAQEGVEVAINSVTRVNGTSRSNNNTRIDGASQTNVWLPHMTAYTRGRTARRSRRAARGSTTRPTGA